MEKRFLGSSALATSVLGFGAGHIGGYEQEEKNIERLLHCAVDSGVTLFDTARSYGLSEERIGKYLSPYRQNIMISSKCGYGIAGYSDWTGDCITAGINEALQRLKTDYIDIMHLHSCPLYILTREDIHESLQKAIIHGKIRVAAYSGENEELQYALHCGTFGSVQSSFNVVEQRNIFSTFPTIESKRLGFLAKRPLANAIWKFQHRPVGHYGEIYWERFYAMGLQTDTKDWEEFALRFCLSFSSVSSILIGTQNENHLLKAVQSIQKGPLSPQEVFEMQQKFQRNDTQWLGQI